MHHCRFAFCASTGRTATMFLATTLGSLPEVVALHEGHLPGDRPKPQLPLINLQNRKAWHDSDFARRTVREMRNTDALLKAAGDASVLIDVAFYNSPLLVPLAELYPDAAFFVIFRRCEGFVRSATVVSGEDLQPAGWPDLAKPLTDREKFISLGRLRPRPGSCEDEEWSDWSAIQRNVWLWHSVNEHLFEVSQSLPNCHSLHYEDLVEDPSDFWATVLRKLDVFSAANLAQCVTRSTNRINQRPAYQVGPADTWDEAELAFYDRLARPLERKLYD